jgi:hypothetical protein
MSNFRIRLAEKHGVFRCEKTNVHLHYYNPQTFVPYLTEDMERAIGFKTLISEALQKEEQKEEAPEQAEPKKEEQKEEAPAKEEAEGDEEGVDLKDLSQSELISFAEENGIDLKALGLKKNSSAVKLREGIEKALLEKAEDHEEA